MKLLYVHTAEKVKKDSNNNYYTDGGYDKNVWNRYINFSENGDIVFFTTLDSKKYQDNEIKFKFNLIPSKIEVKTTNNITNSIKQYFNIRNRFNRKQQIKELVKNADAIIIRVPCNVDAIVAKYAKKYNKPYIVEVVGCILDAYWNYNLKGKILAIPSYIKMKKIVKKSNYCIYVTNKFLQTRYHTKGISISCSDVVINNVNNEDLTKRMNKIKNNNDNIVLGTSAAINIKYKGQENVIRAISLLKKNGYNIEYQLIGNGDKTKLEKIAERCRVSNNVKFLGSIPHEEVFSWLENIDIYIQPSKTEGLPRALIEAMSKACPSIGSKVGGIPELLVDEEFLYKKNNIKELALKIEKLINNKAKMEKSAKFNFNQARNYEFEKINNRRNDFYIQFKKENNICN